MDYEKKYQDALKRAQKVHRYSSDLAEIKRMEDIFPELAEPEDEKIRKSIHIYLDWLDGRKDYAPRGEYTIRDMISWLEKQGNKNTQVTLPAFTFEDALALECSMKTAKITKDGDKLYEMLVRLYDKIHNAYLLEKQGQCQVKESAISQHENKTCKENNDSLTSKDDMMIEETLYFLREYQQSNRCKDENGMQNSVSCEKWLKSLKERINEKQ